MIDENMKWNYCKDKCKGWEGKVRGSDGGIEEEGKDGFSYYWV